MENKKSAKDIILELLREKAIVKLDAFRSAAQSFEIFKKVLRTIVKELSDEIHKSDKRVTLEFRERGELEVELKVAGDILIFQLHSNVFEFDKSHPIWRSSYVKDNAANSYCGIINIYNFLSDSFKYNRLNDVGYLIGRVFINRENHFFVEGKRQLGFLYNDFVNKSIDEAQVRAVCESAIIYCLDFDLLTPPYDDVKEATVFDMEQLSNSLGVKTGKRLGFKFQADYDDFQ